MNTQEAEQLIKDGWVLKYIKDPFNHHQCWLKDPNYNGAGSAKFISYGVYQNLLKLGYKATEYKPKRSEL